MSENFYDMLWDIVMNTFGPISVCSFSPDKNGRGGNKDDIVYAMLECFRRNMPYDEFETKKSFFITRAVKTAVKLYCQEYNLPDYSESIKVNSDNNHYGQVSIEIKHQESDSSEIIYSETTLKNLLYEIIRSHRGWDYRDIVPRFIKENFSYNNYKKKKIDYSRFTGEITITYVNDNKECSE